MQINNRWDIYNQKDLLKYHRGFEVYKLLDERSLVNLAEICDNNGWKFKIISDEIEMRRRRG